MSAERGRALIVRPGTELVLHRKNESAEPAAPLLLPVSTRPRDRRQGKRLPSTAGRGRVVDLRI